MTTPPSDSNGVQGRPDAWKLPGRSGVTHNRPDLGMWIKLPILESIEIAHIAGFDFVVIDLEHSPITTETASGQLAIAAALGLPAFIRIPLTAPSDLARLLDAGAAGVFIPMVESIEDAVTAVQACRFPPLGRRGGGPTSRAGRWGARPIDDYLNDGTAHLAVVLQLESKSAMLNAQAIGAQPGVDAVFFGPTDLAVSMGEPAGSAIVKQVLTDAESAARVDGTIFGTASRVSSAEDVTNLGRAGYSFLMIANDASLLLDAACGALPELAQRM